MDLPALNVGPLPLPPGFDGRAGPGFFPPPEYDPEYGPEFGGY